MHAVGNFAHFSTHHHVLFFGINAEDRKACFCVFKNQVFHNAFQFLQRLLCRGFHAAPPLTHFHNILFIIPQRPLFGKPKKRRVAPALLLYLVEEKR